MARETNRQRKARRGAAPKFKSPSPRPKPRPNPRPNPSPRRAAASQPARSNPSRSNPQPARAQAQKRLKRSVNRLRTEAKAQRQAGNKGAAAEKRTRIANKQVKYARNQLAQANNAGNTKRANRLGNRLENLKTKRNDRRQQSFNSQQNVNSAADFDFAQHSSKKVGVKELAHLKRNKGFSKADIADAAYGSGLQIGKRAQKRLDKWASAKEKANGTPAPATTTTEPNVNVQPSVAPTTSEPTQTISPTPSPSPSSSPAPNPTVVKPNPNPITTPTIDPYTGPNPTIVTPQPTVSPYQPSPQITDIDDSFNDYDDSFNNQNQQDVDYTQELNVNQDNDINNNITGSNNYVNNMQDNSIRNYGGDVRTFNYQSTGKGGVDNPVSAATMAGYYSPSDSHAASAARLDRRVTQANDYAKDNMNTSHIAQGAMRMAQQNKLIDPAAMDARVQARGAASKAQAYMMGNSIYGDLAGFNPQWTQPQSPKPTKMPTFS